MERDVYLVKYRKKIFAGDCKDWTPSKERLIASWEESDRKFISPLMAKFRNHIDDIEHSPHLAYVPKDAKLWKEKVDGVIHEVAEFESFEILKIPRKLNTTIEDLEEYLGVFDKAGIGKHSTHKTLRVWYLGIDEV